MIYWINGFILQSTMAMKRHVSRLQILEDFECWIILFDLNIKVCIHHLLKCVYTCTNLSIKPTEIILRPDHTCLSWTHPSQSDNKAGGPSYCDLFQFGCLMSFEEYSSARWRMNNTLCFESLSSLVECCEWNLHTWHPVSSCIQSWRDATVKVI